MDLALMLVDSSSGLFNVIILNCLSTFKVKPITKSLLILPILPHLNTFSLSEQVQPFSFFRHVSGKYDYIFV